MNRAFLLFLLCMLVLFAPFALVAQAPPAAPTATHTTPTHPHPAGSAIDPALMHPAMLKAKAPDVYEVKFTTTKGDFVVQVTRAWAPLGVGAVRKPPLLAEKGSADPRFWGPRLVRKPIEKPRTPKPGVRAAKIVDSALVRNHA